MLETSLIASLVAFVAGLGILTVLFICLIPIALYLFSSFGLYTMALKKNIEYPCLAWIPIIKLFILGEIIGEKVTISSLKIPYAQVILPVASICSGALIAIPFFGWIIGIAIAVYNYAAYYRLYKLYYSDSAVLFLVLSIIFPFMLSIFPFVIRNRDPYEYSFS